jgi:hypothetical protein
MSTPQGERESQQERSGTMPLNILPVKSKAKPKVRKTKKNEAKKPQHR